MDEQPPNYRREFFRSKHHAWLGLLTLGMGFLLGADRPLFLLLGGAAYVLGWIYLPDMGFFRRAVDRRREESKLAVTAQELAEFQQKRDALLASLSSHLRRRYHELAEVCRQIEKTTMDGPRAAGELADPRLRKLDELMWTFLRLLSLEDASEKFLETERREDLPGRVREAESEIASLSAQIESLNAQRNNSLRDTKEQLLQSRLEALAILRKRQERVEESQADLALVRSEQERLESQIKLIRADASATKGTAGISARIDATVEHLEQTNKWLTEIGEFEDQVGDMPVTGGRVGYSPSAPPKIERPVPGKPDSKQTQR